MERMLRKELGLEEQDEIEDYVELNQYHSGFHKFGGYGTWAQCGEGTIQFQLVDDRNLPEDHPDKQVLVKLPVGDAGTAQYTWNPQAIEGSLN